MRCLVICPSSPTKLAFNERTLESKLSEFVSLAEALKTVKIVGSKSLNIPKIRAGTFFGTGKLDEFISFIHDLRIELVLIDTRLSPMQQRNLERSFKAKVIDRTGLILEIFGSRAQTKEGVLQVELAHLEYQKSRLVRSWTHLERQRGGVGFMGGPGETQIESDRRAIADKISRIKNLLNKVIRTRTLHRKSRKKNAIPIVALVGYTNAGKSSIFNILTGADVLAKDMLFATLDPTMRAFNLLEKIEVILSDTVGFISNLPTGLISAFKATLEEVVNADLIIHVRDISHPENKFQALDVHAVIDELNWDGKSRPPIIEIFNKIDKIDKPKLNALRKRNHNSDKVVLLSAESKIGFQYLEHIIQKYVQSHYFTQTVFLKFNESKKRAWLFEKNLVLNESIINDRFSITVLWSNEKKIIFNKI